MGGVRLVIADLTAKDVRKTADVSKAAQGRPRPPKAANWRSLTKHWNSWHSPH